MTTQSICTITPHQLEQHFAQGRSIELIDVRTPAEFRAVHAPLARNVPLDSLDTKSVLEARQQNTEEPLCIICKSGSRATKAYDRFVRSGFTHVNIVEGGTDAWEQAGLPVVRGKKAVSLERQVRIAAGILVSIGGILALAFHPYFAAVPALVGAGLVFAGITDTCAMGMMLAKMPWNRAT